MKPGDWVRTPSGFLGLIVAMADDGVCRVHRPDLGCSVPYDDHELQVVEGPDA
jgi:hypothetical protein